MNRFAVALLAACLVSVAPADMEWAMHRFDEGRFSVQLPERPARAKRNVRADDRQAVTNLYALETKDGTYMVSYVDSDTFAEDSAGISAVLDAAARGAMTNAGASVIETRAVLRNGFQGRAVQFRGRDGRTFRGLIFLADQRLYQVYAVGNGTWANGKDADRFLNSFTMWR